MKKRVISILLGAIATLTLGVSFPKEAHADWKKDNIGWYYQDNDSYYTGWKLIDNNWYYFYSDGYMATNDKIGDYFVNSTGAWTNEITADEARELIYNEDGNYITSMMKYEGELKYYGEKNTIDLEYWDIPKEPAYRFDLLINICDINDNWCTYFVGKESKNVYTLFNEPYNEVYQMQDNKKVKIYKNLSGSSHRWHQYF